jgi:phosphonoacetate hydrolase
VRTLWEVVAQARPDARLACVDEPIDRGASYSTFQLVRASGSHDGAKSLGEALPDPAGDPHATGEWVEVSPDYRWSTQVDAVGLQQMCQLWSAEAGAPPAVTWWNTTLTDAGSHGGGPRSTQARAALRDSDRRLGRWLDLLQARGLRESVTILLTADHGAVASDPDCRGDWDEALRAAGIPFRDEGYGFLYIGVGRSRQPPTARSDGQSEAHGPAFRLP